MLLDAIKINSLMWSMISAAIGLFVTFLGGWIAVKVQLAKHTGEIKELKKDDEELKELLKENKQKDQEHEKEVLNELKRLEQKSDQQDREIHKRVGDIAQAVVKIEAKLEK